MIKHYLQFMKIKGHLFINVDQNKSRISKTSGLNICIMIRKTELTYFFYPDWICSLHEP